MTEVKFAAAALTVSVAVALNEPDCAVTVTDPAPEPVAMPVLLMLAMLESDEPQFTEFVMSFVVPSDMRAVALNCWPAPNAMAIEAGETWIEETTGAGDKELVVFEPPAAPEPQAVRIDKVSSKTIHIPVFMPNSSESFLGIKQGGRHPKYNRSHSGRVADLKPSHRQGNRIRSP